jgi:hypothetical protein
MIHRINDMDIAHLGINYIMDDYSRPAIRILIPLFIKYGTYYNFDCNTHYKAWQLLIWGFYFRRRGEIVKKYPRMYWRNNVWWREMR